jgi:hypothetical protein
MIPRIAFAVSIAMMLAGGGAVAACPDTPKTDPAKTHSAKTRAKTDNCVDFDAVPQISAHIVANEPAPPVKAPSYEAPATKAYEGPTLGMTKPDPGVKPTPTVGYHWSLE